MSVEPARSWIVTSLRGVAVLVCVAVAAGCPARTPIETPPEPARAPTDGESASNPVGATRSEPAGSGVAAPSSADPRSEATFARRVESVPGTRTGQELLATLLLDAMERDAAEDVRAVLRILGRRLSEYRSDRYEAVLVRALQRFAAAESAPLRHRVDGRYVVPVVEVLLDIRDRAAIERLAESYADGAAGPALANARDLARRFPSADLPIVIGDVPDTCALLIDGRGISGDRATVALGSHTVACANGDRTLVEVRPPGSRVDFVGDELVVSTPVE